MRESSTSETLIVSDIMESQPVQTKALDTTENTVLINPAVKGGKLKTMLVISIIVFIVASNM